jgi:hypothetical protein
LVSLKTKRRISTLESLLFRDSRKTGIILCGRRRDLDPEGIKAAGAVAIAETPWTFHFNDMVNDASSPRVKLIQRSVFDGQTDDAIAEAKKRMHEIISEE